MLKTSILFIWVPVIKLSTAYFTRKPVQPAGEK